MPDHFMYCDLLLVETACLYLNHFISKTKSPLLYSGDVDVEHDQKISRLIEFKQLEISNLPVYELRQ